MDLILVLQLLVSLGTGLLLGALFFGGLWLTIKKLTKVSQPWLLFLLSGLSRTVITLCGFWFIGISLSPNHQWQRIVICLLGFMMMRFFFTRYVNLANTSLSRESHQ
ncbi:ATP synthase subunit I [Gimesia aquarii]|uniref:N-ATPase, AtpR subunit n=1 Tax=Gimesia aquarii TaxID=2527964 RepID=A0A517WZP3_9PLAN|nr:ATP synthase subunit I [Gimesia aquarii]QDU10727.1 N-ATPase, AtpR subunit [Gimesia aquarii]